MQDNKKILVGKIVAPQGLRGELRVQTFTESPLDFQKLNITSEKLKKNSFHFVRQIPSSEIIIAKIDGVEDRTAAEKIIGTELFVDSDSLAPVPAGEFYIADLIDMDVFKKSDGAPLGRVSDVKNFGGGDILELDNGEMILFDGADVDLTKKTIHVL